MEIDIVLKPREERKRKRKEIELIQKEDAEMESYRGLCMKLERLNDD